MFRDFFLLEYSGKLGSFSSNHVNFHIQMFEKLFPLRVDYIILQN